MKSLIACFLILSIITPAQAQLDPFSQASVEIDSALEQLKKEYDSAGYITAQDKSIPWLQRKADAVGIDDPQYAGIIHLYLSFYSIRPEQRGQLMDKAIRYLARQPAKLWYNHLGHLRALNYAFGEAGRIGDWSMADSIVRVGVRQELPAVPLGMELASLAAQQVNEQEYELARELLTYDIYFIAIYHSVDRLEDRLRLQFNQVIYLNAELKQYLEMPYSSRVNIPLPGEKRKAYLDADDPFLKKMQERDLNEDFTRLTDSMRVLYNDLKGHVSNQPALQQFYHELYTSLLLNFATWASLEGYPGRAILPMKIYLADELLPDARAGNTTVVLPAKQFRDIFISFARLYLNLGAYAEAANIVDSGLVFFKTYTHYPLVEKMAVENGMLIMASKASRLQGDTARALQWLQQAESIFKLPDSLHHETSDDLLNFCRVKIEKIYSCLGRQQTKKAFNLLGELYDQFDSLKGMNEDVLIASDIWPDLLYLGADMLARKGTFNHEFINESVERSFNNDDVDIAKKYQGLLLMYKIKWGSKQETSLVLQHLLHFTERQLRHNFILLDPEERMQFYENSLVKIFGLYHELLFSGALDSLPEFKESILAQTLFLKSAMEDGSVYPQALLDAELESDGKKLALRELKRISNLLGVHDAVYIFKNTSGNMELTRDKLKMILIRELQARFLKAEMPFPGWNTIAAKLEKGSIFLEFVRYRSMLADSVDRYGALLIERDKDILAIPLYAEQDIITLLKDAGASPQSAALAGAATRGNEVLGRKPVTNTFKAGDKDKLGELLLGSLWKYIANKQTIYYVPDGILNRISLAALGWQGKYLLQYFNLRQLGNCTAVLKEELLLPDRGKALLAGGLNYGALAPGQRSNSRFSPEIIWDYLSGTNAEVHNVNRLFEQKGYSTALFTDTAFTNATAYTIGNYDIVHLSTHGFYFTGQEAMKVINEKFNRELIRKNPLTRSGLVLSAANNPAVFIDGYLMGYELANFDLRKCYLIALSACETGLGDIRNNMGVDGLPRALSIAGAKKLLITLWKVPDRPTVEFMQKFYTALLSGKMPHVALQETQLSMSEKYPVAAWAAFSLVE